MRHPSPYAAPGFYDKALADGRHRDIVGGRWEETPRIVLPLLTRHGLTAKDHLLDIGAGSLRLGRHLAAMVTAYWATDASRALMLKGWETELDDTARHDLPQDHLVEDAAFLYPNIPDTITFVLAFAVFTHLPAQDLHTALTNLRPRFPHLRRIIFTLFLAPEGHHGPYRQADGVVTHPDRFPWHMTEGKALSISAAAGFTATAHPHRLPRGQVMFTAEPTAP
ncbi:class I SAM-dependent methyltransferase [Fuscovulum ytuae]|uniref:Class I SAM-dependent methyltransferase n=1 Tax=Fuscovulum ytuae TaxID=3042299 RepID=A0ABY8QCV8_9RHOB|nr:class I SAM-dependent methyltransferase [Fuscovulum sp. YMD61]WGV17886.1 class I SAM-dependent methyltransferase [Fuscovulum sp. YMD61]